MINNIRIAVLYHIFYEDTIEFIKEQLGPLDHFTPTYFFNISADAPDQLEIREQLLENFPGSTVTISGNKGKDIGGKLLLLQTCMLSGTVPDWFIFLHDKKSLQALNAKTWKNDLLRIIDASQFDLIDRLISSPGSYGIIAAENYIREEKRKQGKFTGTNGPIMDQLVKEHQIVCKTYDYVAGTMFWAKADVLLGFFNKCNPLKIRAGLESGNVLDNFAGSLTHSWERMLNWIILSNGLTIKAI